MRFLPRLFDLIDNGPTGEVDGVKKEDYAQVEEACTLCDMCFMTKCPYVPPHEWAVDFPHLMLRHRAVQARKKGIGLVDRQLADTDRTGRLGTFAAGPRQLGDRRNQHADAPGHGAVCRHPSRRPPAALRRRDLRNPRRARGAPVNQAAPAFGKRKAVLYATCFVNFNNTDIGAAARAVLAQNGVETEVVYPACCGMPKLELGDIERPVAAARQVTAALLPWVDKGYDVIALTPSCALDAQVRMAAHPAQGSRGRAPVAGDVRHLGVRRRHRQEGRAWRPASSRSKAASACILPVTPAPRTWAPRRPRCCAWCPRRGSPSSSAAAAMAASGAPAPRISRSAVKVGKPAAQAALKNDTSFVVSECPLAAEHLMQVMEMTAGEQKPKPFRALHPIELLARAYGLMETGP